MSAWIEDGIETVLRDVSEYSRICQNSIRFSIGFKTARQIRLE